METSPAFPSPFWIVLSHYPVFHPSLGIWLCQEHSQSQHRWFRNLHRTCHGCAQPFLKAEPVPCALTQPPFPRTGWCWISVSLVPPQQEFPKLLNLCLLHNVKITNHFKLFYFGEAKLGANIHFFSQTVKLFTDFFVRLNFLVSLARSD